MKIKSSDIKDYSVPKLYKLMDIIIEKMKDTLKEKIYTDNDKYDKLKELYILVSDELIKRDFQ